MNRLPLLFLLFTITTFTKAQTIIAITSATDKAPDTIRGGTLEKVPEFPGGVEQFHHYLARGLKYPGTAMANNIQGIVIISFIVGIDGSLNKIKVAKSVSPDIDEEAVRLIKASPRWAPGTQNGKPVATLYSVPIEFKLDNRQNRPVIMYPKFPDGTAGFYKYLSENTIFTKGMTVTGVTNVLFVIEKDGSVTNAKIQESVSPALDKEAIRLVLLSPKWSPATLDGKPVSAKYSLPIDFQEIINFADNELIKPKPDKAFDENKIFTVVNVAPEFIGGWGKFNGYLKQNIEWPANSENVKGTVTVSFVVERDGGLSGLRIQKSLSPEMDTEALRLVKNSAKWRPGFVNGRAVRVAWSIPVAFDKAKELELSEAIKNKPIIKDPQFPGGFEGFYKYLHDNTIFTDGMKVEGKTVITFMVEKNGHLTEAKIVRSVSPALDKEALRLIAASPKWEPGTQNGKAVRLQYTLPIDFQDIIHIKD